VISLIYLLTLQNSECRRLQEQAAARSGADRRKAQERDSNEQAERGQKTN